MNIVVWIGGEENQKALVSKLHMHFGVKAIVVEKRKKSFSPDLTKIMGKVAEKLFMPSISAAWFGMQSYYHSNFKMYPDVPILITENINSPEVADFTKINQAELVVVSGTRLVKNPNLSIPLKTGMINLHTGLSPFVKGGPNCTNWCLANRYYHLIGNTIMWIDKGIDTGNLLATEHTFFVGNETLKDVHIKVMEHAHDLCLRAVRYLNNGGNRSIPQSEFGEGKTYYTRDWNNKQKRKLLSGFARFSIEINSKETISKREQIKVLSLRN